MTHEFDRSPTFRLISLAFADFADLTRKEIRLAAAEASQRVSATVRGAAMLAAAGALAAFGLLFAMVGVALVIATTGLALFWCFFIVAGGLILLALALALVGKGSIGLTPERSVEQMKKTVNMAREQVR
jgi:cytochrome c biogenesis protein CcdA